MARGVKWQIKFKSQAGIDCLVNIYKEGYTGTPLQLIGGERPVYWEEDTSDDLLSVIRVKTGYISFIEETFGEWDEVFPTNNTDRYVTVSYNRKTVFTGFLQAQSFENEWAAPPREIQIPIQSPLGIANGILFDPESLGSGVLTSGAILKCAINQLGAEYSYVYFPDTTGTDVGGGEISQVTLNEKVRTLLVSPYNKDYDRTEAKQGPLDLYDPVTLDVFIEGICNAYGWMVHDEPDSLVFTKHDHTGDYLRRNVSALDNVAGDIFLHINSQIDISQYISISSDDGTINTILPISRLEMDFGQNKIESGEMNFDRCTRQLYHRNPNLLLFRIYYWLNPMSNEFTGSLLYTGSNIAYMSTSKRLQRDGCYLTYMSQSKLEEDAKASEYMGILIQWSTSWAQHTNLCRVRLPYPAGILPALVVTTAGHSLFYNSCELKVHFMWARGYEGSSNDDLFRSDGHANFKIDIALMNSSGKYFHSAPTGWNDSVAWFTVTVDGSTGDATPIKFNMVDQVQNDSLFVLFRTTNNDNLTDHEPIFIDSIRWENQATTMQKLSQFLERPVDAKFTQNNGSTQDASVSQFLTPYVYSDNLIGEEPEDAWFTSYSYMFESQKHLMISSRHNLPSDPYLPPLTYTGRTDWKLLAIGFDPRNDEYSLTLHTF